MMFSRASLPRPSVLAILFLLGALPLLAACGDSDGMFGLFGETPKPKLEGTRVDALQMDNAAPALQVDQSLTAAIILPAAVKGESPQVGSNAQHEAGNQALAADPKSAWSSSIGSGASDDQRLLTIPVIADGRIFTMDTDSEVRAFDAKSGDALWSFSVLPENEDVEDAFGGGLAYAGGNLYVTTGAGEVAALKAADGTVIWRRHYTQPFRGAPTYAEGHLYAISFDNQVHALDAANGADEWTHTGIVETAALLGASSPAVAGDLVIVPYSSGELFGLRTQNGHVEWSENLAAVNRSGILPGMADIRALPVIDGDQVFALSHSGRMIALALRTGSRLWDRDIGGVETAAAAGDYLFLLTSNSDLVAIKKDDGHIKWVLALPTTTAEEGKGDPVFWTGPALGGDRLWIASSDGRLYAVAAATGQITDKREGLGAFYLPPVIAEGTLFLLSNDGELSAYR